MTNTKKTYIFEKSLIMIKYDNASNLIPKSIMISAIIVKSCREMIDTFSSSIGSLLPFTVDHRFLMMGLVQVLKSPI